MEPRAQPELRGLGAGSDFEALLNSLNRSIRLSVQDRFHVGVAAEHGDQPLGKLTIVGRLRSRLDPAPPLHLDGEPAALERIPGVQEGFGGLLEDGKVVRPVLFLCRFLMIPELALPHIERRPEGQLGRLVDLVGVRGGQRQHARMTDQQLAARVRRHVGGGAQQGARPADEDDPEMVGAAAIELAAQQLHVGECCEK